MEWKKDGTFDRLMDLLRRDLRQAECRQRQPSAAIIDTKSVKTTEKRGPRGSDAGQQVHGCKRHILVDTLGLILAVVVHPADIQDRDGAKLVLEPWRHRFSRLRLIVADTISNGGIAPWLRSLRAPQPAPAGGGRPAARRRDVCLPGSGIRKPNRGLGGEVGSRILFQGFAEALRVLARTIQGESSLILALGHGDDQKEAAHAHDLGSMLVSKTYGKSRCTFCSIVSIIPSRLARVSS